METGFELLNIILLESNFRRANVISFSNLQTKLAFNVGNSRDKDSFSVVLELILTQENQSSQSVEVEANVKMVAVFRHKEDAVLDINDFVRVNAPAIIFPFIREHIANLSMRAGIPLIMLQPINFTKLSNE